MKKTILLLLTIFSLTACHTSEEKFLFNSLNDPSSYENISINEDYIFGDLGEVDTLIYINTFVDSIPTEIGDLEILHGKDSDWLTCVKTYSDYKRKLVNFRIKRYSSDINDTVVTISRIIRKVNIKYRAKNAYGGLVICNDNVYSIERINNGVRSVEYSFLSKL